MTLSGRDVNGYHLIVTKSFHFFSSKRDFVGQNVQNPDITTVLSLSITHIIITNIGLTANPSKELQSLQTPLLALLL